ncbi:hypothetical protein PTTG_25395 [Puccinia triticina 1-1 BBBD Race 1]|uniref:Uncharacterized protein n=1 Tax=Puccinia triticina (isolate 1-1 / race 1 (BBBD)) TaxID=630390 RepID=A0A180H3D3_PUCT1|nr:hypothetical protein PTTG_25395 [Puccinia triticina 1-1 BBBD Race 1]
MARLAATWLKVILCDLIWMTAVLPSENADHLWNDHSIAWNDFDHNLSGRPGSQGSVQKPYYNPWDMHSEVWNGVQHDLSRRPRPQRFADADFPYHVHSQPLDGHHQPHAHEDQSYNQESYQPYFHETDTLMQQAEALPQSAHTSSETDPLTGPGTSTNQVNKPRREAATLLYSGGPSMHQLDQRVRQAKDSQSINAVKRYELFTEKLDRKHNEIAAFYAYLKSSKKMGGSLKELGGLKMIVRQEDFGARPLQNFHIRLPTEERYQRSGGYDPVRSKIDKISAALNSYHNLYYKNKADLTILGRTKQSNTELLEWFYEQMFTNTDNHPPLLGEVEQIEHRKKFTQAQQYLHVALNRSGQLNQYELGYLATHLLKCWYRDESSKIPGTSFSDLDYDNNLTKWVDVYPPENRKKRHLNGYK